jgi:signal transduction histidine kinase/predicted hydrocarbon binding protein
MTQTVRDFLSEDREGVLCFSGARMALLDIEAGFWGLRRQMEALVGRQLTDAVLQQAGANGGASFARSFVDQTPAPNGPQAFRDCVAAYQAAGFGRFEVVTLEWPLGRVVVHGEETFESWAAIQHGKSPRESVCAYTAGVLVGFINVLAGRNDVVCIQKGCQAEGAEGCIFELLPADSAGGVPVVSMAPNPALSRQLNLLEILFERMPMGIAVFDRELRVRRFNPTWADFITRYTPATPGPIVPGAYFFDLDPGTEDDLMPIFERVLSGETVYLESFPIHSDEVVSYWDAVLSPLVEDNQVVGFIDVTTDATERRTAEKALEESQRILSTLISNLPGMAYRCRNEPRWTMSFVSEGSFDLTGYRPNELIENRVVSYGDLIHPADKEEVWEGVQSAVAERKPFQKTYRLLTPEGEKWVWEQGRGVFSDEGALLALEGFITDVSERVMNQQTLERRVQERTQEIEQRRRVAEGLRGILKVLNSTRSLDEVLDYIVQQATELLGAQAGLFFRFDGQRGWAVFEASYGFPPDLAGIESMAVDSSSGNRDLLNRQPVGITDFPAYVDAALEDPEAGLTEDDEWWYGRLASLYQSIMATPLILRDEVYGGLLFYYEEQHGFSKDDYQLGISLADQTALAIENARLRMQAEQAAAMEERQRLARELHDSVSQALYGIGLGARTARTLLDREALDPEVRTKLVSPLDYVLSLADAGLTEMRALIFELRPDALEKEGLVAALKRQAETLRVRHNLEVETDLCGEPDVPIKIKEALYRIGQEALNNAVQHARASRIEVELQRQDDVLCLSVEDDGVGFDPEKRYPGHLGLKSMQERAAQLGGTLTIDSAPDQGARVQVEIPCGISSSSSPSGAGAT